MSEREFIKCALTGVGIGFIIMLGLVYLAVVTA